MTEQFTTQEVIDMASTMYNEEGLTKEELHLVLKTWQEMELWDVSDAKLEKVFNKIIK